MYLNCTGQSVDHSISVVIEMNNVRKFLIRLLLKKQERGYIDSLEKQGVSFDQFMRHLGNNRYVTNSGHVLKLSYSQFAQDLVLSSCYFFNKQSGFYVDVGANHPYLLSNTVYFYKQGWNGINVEPNPAFIEDLQKERPRDININCAVANLDGEMDFYLCEPKYNCLSTLSVERAEELMQKGINWTKKRIDVLKLSTIFQRHLSEGQSIDFMNVDCEGYDIEVLKSNDWDRYRPRMLVVEDLDNIDTPLVQYCKTINYDLVSWFGYTKFFKDMKLVN